MDKTQEPEPEPEVMSHQTSRRNITHARPLVGEPSNAAPGPLVEISSLYPRVSKKTKTNEARKNSMKRAEGTQQVDPRSRASVSTHQRNISCCASRPTSPRRARMKNKPTKKKRKPTKRRKKKQTRRRKPKKLENIKD